MAKKNSKKKTEEQPDLEEGTEVAAVVAETTAEATAPAPVVERETRIPFKRVLAERTKKRGNPDMAKANIDKVLVLNRSQRAFQGPIDPKTKKHMVVRPGENTVDREFALSLSKAYPKDIRVLES